MSDDLTTWIYKSANGKEYEFTMEGRYRKEPKGRPGLMLKEALRRGQRDLGKLRLVRHFHCKRGDKQGE